MAQPSHTRWWKRGALGVAVLLCVALAMLGTSMAAQAGRPSYFGTTEVRSGNLQPFPKWNDVMARFRDQERNPDAFCPRSGACRAREWQGLITRLQGKPAREQVEEVNRFFNAIPYVQDINNWRKNDYWATPYEFMLHNGDCEDYAIAKFVTLRKLGLDNDDMRIVILQDFNLGGIMHAVLEVKLGGEALILDNQASQVRAAEKIYHYKPIYSINESAWWAYRY